MYENHRVFETDYCGKKLVVETGKYAELANGSAMIRYGDTAVLAAVTASAEPREGVDFFPLSVEFQERLYSVGKIPGSFLKREGRPSDKAVLASRVIDRPIRPLFPKDMRNDVAVVLTVMSVDNDCLPEIVGMIGASVALSISDVPWAGPIGGANVGYVDGEIIVNPTYEQREKSTLNLTVAASAEKVVMIEAGANEVTDEVMFDAIMKAHEKIKPIVEFINRIKAEVGKPKFEFKSMVVDEEMYNDIKDFCLDKVKAALDTDDKRVRDARLKVVTEEINEHFAEKYPAEEYAPQIAECLYKIQKFVVRRWLLDDGKRVDGRAIDQIRPLHAEIDILPRTHGSALFARGQTQVLTAVTLGSVAERQLLDGIDPEEFKRYMHHYNMPPYSVGEAKTPRSPGRREIGHGALAERALEPVIPGEDEFPYSIRLVSEVLTSNGSTSQGSICASTLALMAAGVPIRKPVAGISCGLVTEGERWLTMVDIQGVEDFFGDMDFKVAGTKDGITAIQMDLKIDGLTPEIIKSALEKTHKARNYILDEVILKCIPEPRKELSPYAPKMLTMAIPVDKIKDVIGKGGSVIQKIVADTGTKIDVEEDGRIFISCIDIEAGNKAMNIINTIVNDPIPGVIYTGRVTKIIPIGAFVEIAPGKEGLVHIRDLDNKFVQKVEDVVSVGDEIIVKCKEIDSQGRINLSRKAALAKPEPSSHLEDR